MTYKKQQYKNMVSVILPTYNESENIRVIVSSIFDVFKGFELEGEVIVVDDNSPDGTAEIAGKLEKDYPVHVCVRKTDRGLATAVLKGFEMASGDVCVVMDADLSHPVKKIPEMVKPILENTCDATVGSRYVGGGGCENWSFVRRFISRFSGFLARGLTKLTDPTSGFMAIRRTALDGVLLDPIGWKIVLEVIVKTGVRFQEVSIRFSDRQKGKSKLNLRVQGQFIAHLWRLYGFKYPVMMQFIKFCVVGFSGLLLDTAILMLLVELAHLDPRIGAVFAFFGAVTSNYAWNRLWTFNGSRSLRILTSYFWFITICIGGLMVRLVVMHLLIEFGNMGSGYRYVSASLLGIFFATIFNFLGSKILAFSKKLHH
jgi:dolichol-phosphate mannosyltransferase